MTHHTDAERALSNLRHLYSQMTGGLVKDSAQAKSIADGLLAKAIASLEHQQMEKMKTCNKKSDSLFSDLILGITLAFALVGVVTTIHRIYTYF